MFFKNIGTMNGGVLFLSKELFQNRAVAIPLLRKSGILDSKVSF
jgi:hypothetical protein